MSDPQADFTAFKNCMRTQANLDLEAWDVVLWQPLKDFFGWWTRQSDATKAFATFLAGAGASAFTRWVGRVAAIASTEVAGLFAEALIAVIAGLALGTFLEAAGRCILPIVA